MKTAAQIMKTKEFIKTEFIDRQLPPAQSQKLWNQATAKLDTMMQQFADLPKGVRMHTDNSIFPAAAVYLTAKNFMSDEQAYAVMENAAIYNSTGAGKKLANLMKIPFLRDLFILALNPLTKRMFGIKNGFRYRIHPKEKGVFRMDVLACPYCKYLTALGCPELIKMFCENDERVYGNLPGIKFERASTLGKGADRCDFCIRKV